VAAEFATAFTRLVGCRAPIQLAVMGGGTGTPELAAAVSQAGGLGMLSSTFPMPVDEQLSWVQERTERPVGVGFFAFELPTRTGELDLAARRARVVDVFWGDPDATVVERIHAGGAIAFWQVGSLEEAVAAVDAGCDAVIAQGIEAGGHVRGTTPLAALLRQVIAAVEVPVIAAGGIATGAALAAALNAGASAARVGTRFPATAESGAHPRLRGCAARSRRRRHRAHDRVRRRLAGRPPSRAAHRQGARGCICGPGRRPRRLPGPQLGGRPPVRAAADGIHHWRGGCHGHVRRLRRGRHRRRAGRRADR